MGPSDPACPSLCLGGSFNPPHFGHLIVARAVAETLGFGGVRLVVAGRPPHKPQAPDILPEQHRLAMCRLAVENHAFFQVDDREIRRAGPSYTIQTARELQDQGLCAGPVPWMIGADLLASLPDWHEADRLIEGKVVHFVVVRRPGHAIDWSSLPPAVRRLEANVVQGPQIDISATEIRDRARRGLDIRYLVPDSVRAYISTHGLYH